MAAAAAAEASAQEAALASAGVPFGVGLLTANDSALLTGASAAELEAAVRAAQEELLERGRRDRKQQMRSERRRRALADRVLGKGGNELLARVRAKLQEHGIELPTVQVEFRGVQVKTDALVGAAGIQTVGSVPLALLRRLLGRGKQQTREIAVLGGPGGPLSGILKPGRATLLLGPPGCGKTALMRVLGARLEGCGALDVAGQVLYNGRTKDEFAVARAVGFVEQTDNHTGALTVEETLSFAHLCQVGAAAGCRGSKGARGRSKGCGGASDGDGGGGVRAQILEAKAARSLADLRQLSGSGSCGLVGGGGGGGAASSSGAGAGAARRESPSERLRAAARAQLEEDEVRALLITLFPLSPLLAPSPVRRQQHAQPRHHAHPHTQRKHTQTHNTNTGRGAARRPLRHRPAARRGRHALPGPRARPRRPRRRRDDARAVGRRAQAADVRRDARGAAARAAAGAREARGGGCCRA